MWFSRYGLLYPSDLRSISLLLFLWINGFCILCMLPPVGLSGLEPPTSRLSGVRSNQLSYKPSNLALTCSPMPFPA